MPIMCDISLPSSFFSTAATLDEKDGYQMALAEERRKRRMLSNRESARRSRMRKQNHLRELRTQVISLRSTNCQLLNEINHLMRDYDQLVHENDHLASEETELQKRLENVRKGFACDRQDAENA